MLVACLVACEEKSVVFMSSGGGRIKDFGGKTVHPAQENSAVPHNPSGASTWSFTNEWEFRPPHHPQLPPAAPPAPPRAVSKVPQVDFPPACRPAQALPHR